MTSSTSSKACEKTWATWKQRLCGWKKKLPGYISRFVKTDSLRQEKEEREADSASHKVKTSELYRLLLVEEENRKDENWNLKAETKRLKAAITEEREERMEVVANLEGAIERQDAKLEECEKELMKAKMLHDTDMHNISEVCTTVLCSFSPLILTSVHSSSPESWSPSTSGFFNVQP